ncbi:MAG: homoserine kinase, partial [Aeromicrobium sp.]|nr:homoserine kinase [Aeromicrobium sp.]
MSFVAGPVTVRVPASSANLGPGFDALGLALTLYDDVTGEVIPEGLEIDVVGDDPVALDDTHLVARAMYAAFDLLGERPAGLRLSCVNAIPHGRGLGSSAAAIVGGVVLARSLVEDGATRLDDAAVYQLAADLEGHPDNVAGAVFGGLTVAWLDGVDAGVERLDSAADVTVFVPPDAVSTEKARGLLPDQVPHRDAAYNAGRAALLVVALTSASDRLLEATDDRLHQAYRSGAMPDSYALMQSLR